MSTLTVFKEQAPNLFTPLGENMKFVPFKKSALVAAVGLAAVGTQAVAEQFKLEEVVVVAEKRSESLQDLSQAVTAITSNELDQKNIKILCFLEYVTGKAFYELFVLVSTISALT